MYRKIVYVYTYIIVLEDELRETEILIISVILTCIYYVYIPRVFWKVWYKNNII